ncbi:hypothetical protein [Candidatus Poriferisodalis sp.]|uniref:hypothetical protein n=1 Tax=Candidatus Poriferisodalis sp. TaxID=3101277 RepID=UPI003B59CC12
MAEVLVYPNLEAGPRWCAEDDRGFTGAADRLASLIEMIEEWAEAEGFADELEVRLVGPATAPSGPEPDITFTKPGYMPTTDGGALPTRRVLAAV